MLLYPPQLLLIFANNQVVADISALLAIPLGVVPPPSMLLVLFVLGGLVGLVILGLFYINHAERADQAEATIDIEPPAPSENDEMVRFMNDMVEQLKNVIDSLSDTAPGSKHPPAAPIHAEPMSPHKVLVQANHNSEAGSATDRPCPPESTGSTLHRLTLCHPPGVDPPRAFAEAVSQFSLKTRAKLEGNSCRLVSADKTNSPYYLTFMLGREQFALNTSSVCGVVSANQLISAANMPRKRRRAIKLLGSLVPVIDLGACFGSRPIEIHRDTRIVILEMTAAEDLQLIGLLIDSVGQVRPITPTEIKPPLFGGNRLRNDLSVGTAMLDNHPTTLLEIGQELSATELLSQHASTLSAQQESTPT